MAMYMISSAPTMVSMEPAVIRDPTVEEAALKIELTKCHQENGELKKKLSAKTAECDRLRREARNLKVQCEQFKGLMKQLNDSIANGQTPGFTLSIPSPPTKRRSKSSSGDHLSACFCLCHQDKPFQCDWPDCGRRFRQKSHLEAHNNTHTGRRFPCDWPGCGKSFVRKYILDEHRKLHTQINPNTCDYPNCGKSFSSRYSLTRHQSFQHKNQQQPLQTNTNDNQNNDAVHIIIPH